MQLMAKRTGLRWQCQSCWDWESGVDSDPKYVANTRESSSMSWSNSGWSRWSVISWMWSSTHLALNNHLPTVTKSASWCIHLSQCRSWPPQSRTKASQAFCHQCLACTRWPSEQEQCNWPIFIQKPTSWQLNSVCNSLDSFWLSHNTVWQNSPCSSTCCVLSPEDSRQEYQSIEQWFQWSPLVWLYPSVGALQSSCYQWETSRDGHIVWHPILWM